jgi:hypothetical protein
MPGTEDAQGSATIDASNAQTDVGSADSPRPDALPNCCPVPGDYFVEVIGAIEGGEVYRAGSLGSGTTAAGIDCAPVVPWAYRDSSGNWGIHACASSDSTRGCIDLDNGNPMGGGRYVDPSGTVSTLRHLPLMPSGDPPSGEYTASMLDPNGLALNIHGRFTVCLAFQDSL